ncbi:MAG: caspase family protein [Bacteroidetes bacterium]|nr:caspase family protein [Bacteroidota bacterium]
MKIRRTLVLLLLMHITFDISAQQARGPIPVQQQEQGQYDTTYALVVGISKYQNVQSLQYADADAQAFYNFLRSPAGGNVDSLNIKLWLNENAKAQSITTARSWLSKRASPHTRIYIYFACHGDSYDEQEAFLLAYDAPPGGDDNLYITGGTIQVFNLKNRVKYMTSKSAEVVLITDACRTNDLPGKVNGIRYTNAKIMEENAGEIQFASCSANQTSMEGAAWGGGRGLFSYHLVNGMSGLADKDNDGNVSWYELKNYVIDSVRADSKSSSGTVKQTPTFFCEETKIDRVADHVDAKMKAKALQSIHPNTKPKSYSKADNITRAGLIHFDDYTTQQDYLRFQAELNKQNYIAGKSESAFTQLNKLLSSSNVSEERKSDLKDLYIDEVMNYCQDLVNDYLGGDRTILSSQSIFNASGAMKSLIGMVVLEGNERNNFMGKYYFFMAREQTFGLHNEQFELGITYCDSSIKYQPNAAYIYNTRGMLHGSLGEYDLALADVNKALSLAPNWVFPMVGMAAIEVKYFNNCNAAISWCKKALAVDSTFTSAYDMMGTTYHRMYNNFGGDNDTRAIACMKKSIAIAPQFSGPYRSLASYYYSYYKTDSVLHYLNLAYSKDSSNWNTIKMLGDYYSNSDVTLANNYFSKSLALGGDSAEIYTAIGQMIERGGNDSIAYEYYKKAFKINNWNVNALYCLTDYWQKYNADDASIKFINRLIAVDSTKDYLYRLKGDIFLRKEDGYSARANYSKAYRIAPYNQINILCLIRFYAKINPSDPLYATFLAKGDSIMPRGEEVVRRNMDCQIIGKNLDSAYQLINYYREQIEHYNSLKYFAGQICSYNKKYNEAISWYEKAGKQIPQSDYRIYIANTLLESGDIPGATKVAKEQVAAHPNSADGRLLLGNLFLQSGFNDSVIAIVGPAMPSPEKDFQKSFLLGRAYQLRGDDNRAIKYFENCTLQKPDFATAYLCLSQLYQKKAFKKGKAKKYLRKYDELQVAKNTGKK